GGHQRPEDLLAELLQPRERPDRPAEHREERPQHRHRGRQPEQEPRQGEGELLQRPVIEQEADAQADANQGPLDEDGKQDDGIAGGLYFGHYGPSWARAERLSGRIVAGARASRSLLPAAPAAVTIASCSPEAADAPPARPRLLVLPPPDGRGPHPPLAAQL